jgi:NAD(P)-dependent dehydrogenase (short-subunit alcohol dehydrogenase family)
MSEGLLRGKTVVVTGAASGIGAAVVGRARDEGARVIGLDLRASEDIEHVDLALESSIEAAAERLPEQIDALCNVAGVPGTLPPATVLSVNLLGLRHLTELLRPRLLGGAVVNVASTAGGQWQSVIGEIDDLLATSSIAEGLHCYEARAPEMPVYDFSKAALIVWTMRTAWGWRQDAPAVCFLASSPAAWINGVDLIADGGFATAMASGAVDLAALRQGGMT